VNPQEPVIPDPMPPGTTGAPVDDPANPDQPAEYSAYDQAEADSFPASDPPAASEPGA
jgi:hypothetical protein